MEVIIWYIVVFPLTITLSMCHYVSHQWTSVMIVRVQAAGSSGGQSGESYVLYSCLAALTLMEQQGCYVRAAVLESSNFVSSVGSTLF